MKKLLIPAILLHFIYSITVNPPVESGNFRNPFRGWVSWQGENLPGYHNITMGHVYFSWRDIEGSQDNFNWNALNNEISAHYSAGRHSQIRLVLDYPGSFLGSGKQVPDYVDDGSGTSYSGSSGSGYSPNYNNSFLWSRLQNFISNYGQLYNNDDRVAVVQIGTIGHFGEWHICDIGVCVQDLDSYLSPTKQQELIDWYVTAFPDKFLELRHPKSLISSYDNIGYYDDSWVDQTDCTSGPWCLQWWFNSSGLGNRWQTAMCGGEFADHSHLPNNYTTVKNLVMNYHPSTLGPGGPANWGDDPRVHEVQNILGYRFEIQSADFNATIQKDLPWNFSMTVNNTGSAPFYHGWKIELSLLDGSDNVVWSGLLNEDLAGWLPGVHTINESVIVPGSISDGTYKLAAAIRKPGTDPASTWDLARFANTPVINQSGRWKRLNLLNSITVIPGDPGLVQPPASNLVLSTLSSTSLQLTWENPQNQNFDYIMIQRDTSASPLTINDGTTVYTGSAELYTDSGLTSGQTYYYTVFARNTNGYWSSGLQADKTLSALPNVSSFTVTARTNALDLSWVNPTNTGGGGGDNQVLNPDFSSGTTSWGFWNNGGTSASFSESGEEGVINITSAGGSLWELSLSQSGLVLSNGVQYTMSVYLRCASGTRTVDFRIRHNGADPNYAIISPTINTTMTKYETTFTMGSGTDTDCQLMIDCGGNTTDVYVDDVYLSGGSGGSGGGTSEPAGIRIVRQLNTPPLTPFDGSLVYDGLAESYSDSPLTPGVTYFYSAFAYWTNAGVEYADYVLDASSSGIPLGTSTDTTGPDAPVIVSPAPGISTGVQAVEFIWQSATDPSGISFYEIEIGTKLFTNISTNFIPLSGLDDGLQTWRVRAHDGVGNPGTWSSPRNITIDAVLPGDVILTSPLNGEQVTNDPPSFNWQTATDAVSYIIDVDGSENPTAGTAFTPAAQLGTGSHLWRVRAIDNSGNLGNWSTAWSLIIGTNTPLTVSSLAVTPLTNALRLDWVNPAIISALVFDDFEADISGWSTGGWNGYSSLSLETTTTYGGSTGSLRLDYTVTNDWGSGTAQYYPGAADWSSYDTLSMQVHINNSPEVKFSIQFFMNNGDVWALENTTLLSGPAGWVEYAVPFSSLAKPSWHPSNAAASFSGSGISTFAISVADNVGGSTSGTIYLDDITFSDSSAGGASFDGVRIVRRDDGTSPMTIGDGTTVFTGMSDTFTDNGVYYPTNYCYTVFAYGIDGGTTNYGSTSAGAMDCGVPLESGDGVPPAAPVLISPANSSSLPSPVTLDWQAVSDASGILRYELEIDSGSPIIIPGGTTSYTASGLSAGAHSWRVRAVDGVMNIGSYSSPWSFTIDLSVPPSVTGLQVTAGTNELDISWVNPVILADILLNDFDSGIAGWVGSGYTGTGTLSHETGTTYGGSSGSLQLDYDITNAWGSGSAEHYISAADWSSHDGISFQVYANGDSDVKLAVQFYQQNGDIWIYEDSSILGGTPGWVSFTVPFSSLIEPGWHTGNIDTAYPGTGTSTLVIQAADNTGSVGSGTIYIDDVTIYTSSPSGASWDGVRLVRKAGGEPADVNDGLTVYTGASETFLDTSVTGGTSYCYKAFSYNLVSGTNYDSPGTGAYDCGTPFISATIPSAPTALNTAAVTSSSISLSWSDQAGDEMGYEVFWNTSAVMPGSPGAVLAADSESYTVSSLDAGTLYYLWVRATNQYGPSAAPMTSATTTVPAPTLLIASAAGLDSIDLSWTDNTANETGFYIYLNTVDSRPAAAYATNTANDTDVTVNGLSEGTLYYFWVTAFTAANESPDASASTATGSLPPAPSLFSVDNITENSFDMLWNDSGIGESGYYVYLSSSAVQPSAPAYTNSADVTNLNISGLNPGTTYYIWISAFNTYGESAALQSSAGTGMVGAPNAPGNLSGTVIGTDRIDLSWSDQSSDEDGFYIYWNTTNIIPALPGRTNAANDGTFSLLNLSDNTSYYLWVSAYNASGESGRASTLIFLQGLPSQPSNFQTGTVQTNSIQLVWDDSLYENGYQLYVNTASNRVGASLAAGLGASETTYLVSSLSPGATYHFWLAATNSTGASQEAYLAVTTISVTPPNGPAGLSIDAATLNSLSISWLDQSSDEDNFYIYWNTTPVQPGTQNATLGAGTTNFLITGLSSGTTYYIWVSAYKTIGGESGASSTSGQTAVSPPAAPQVLLVREPGTGSIEIIWLDNSVSETSFNIYWSDSFIRPALPQTNVSADITNLLVLNFPLTGAYFWVEAENSGGTAVSTMLFYQRTNITVLPPARDYFTELMALPGVVRLGDVIRFVGIKYTEELQQSRVNVFNMNSELIYSFEHIDWQEVEGEYYGEILLPTETPTASGEALKPGVYFLFAGKEYVSFIIR